jgi:hypothetical protein
MNAPSSGDPTRSDPASGLIKRGGDDGGDVGLMVETMVETMGLEPTTPCLQI